MTRSISSALFGLATVVGLSGGQSPAAVAPSDRPNVVWLTVEDMSPWLACYGDSTAPTPNLDRLAREGVRYSNAFATSPVCAPARHALITGLYATSTGAMHMRTMTPSKLALERDPRAYDDVPLYEAVPPPHVRCFSELLRQAGYYATNNAKEDYQFRAPPTAWDESSNRAHWRHRRQGQPFFAVFNCNFTHESQAFPEAPRREEVVGPADVKLPPYYPDTPLVRQTMAQTYNNVAAMDRWVGERLEELEQARLLDSTIVIFFSDHGVGLPRGKRSSYDSGLRVPLIIRFPDGRGAGTTNDRLVSFVDFAPTMLSLVGVKPPDYLPGRAFLGSFEQPAAKYVFATQDRMDVNPDTVRSVSDGRFRYLRNLRPEMPHLPSIAYRDHIPMMRDLHALKASGNATPEQWQVVSDRKPAEEFYDNRADPHEVKNLIDAPEHQERVAAMRQALDRWTADTKDLGLIRSEHQLVREILWPPEGKQPETASPVAQLAREDGRVTMSVECATDGASIGYRRAGERSWSVYTSPTEVEPSAVYEFIAHRIGFKPSTAIRVVPARE